VYVSDAFCTTTTYPHIENYPEPGDIPSFHFLGLL
jgi:hypothetical protein